MLRVTWRNLVARKVRLALSAFAIVLGVAFVAGSFIFTDALGGAFNGIIKGTTADVEVRPDGSQDFDSAQDARTIPASVIKKLEELPEAGHVGASTQMQGVYVIGKNGKLVGGNGPPSFAFNFTETKAITGKPILTIIDGRLPVGPSEIALDETTADKGDYEIGDEVTLVTPGKDPKMTAELTGLVQFGSKGGLVGATLTIFDLKTMQDLFFDGKDVYSSASLTAAEGVSQAELAAAARPLLPAGIVANEGDTVADEGQQQIGEVLGFINTFLLVFAAVAMIVGTFLIINTFSILVAQRSRELALLRAMGASKKQVTRSVMAEAFAVSLIGSTLGIGAGYVLAKGIKALFGVIGLDLGGADFPIKLRTILISYAVGVLVTMLAAYLPARRASHIAPVAAMRDDVALPESSLRRRLLVGGGLIAAGIAGMVLGFAGEGGRGLLLIGLGMLGILIGVAMLAPVIGRPVIHGLGLIFRPVFGTVGTLATENSLRNPRRTAATASALMIGLTLVALMSILGQSSKASIDKAIKGTLTSDLVVSNAVGASFSPAIADEIRQLDGVDTVAQFRQANAKIGKRDIFVGAADPNQLAKVLNVQIDTGSVAGFQENSILIDAEEASGQGYEVGDKIALRFQGGTVKLNVAGVFAVNSMPAQYIVSLKTLEEGAVKPEDALLFITKKPDASVTKVRADIDQVLKDLPTVTLKNQQEFVDEQLGFINTALYIIYALLGLAVVIAVLGIINTLALSVIERTREVGLLRAIGLSRRQLRTMVRLESVAIAVLGAVLGIAMGLVFGITLQRAIADQGIDVLSIPWGRLGLFVLLAAIVGVLAAVLPARRAAKLNVLEAISTE